MAVNLTIKNLISNEQCYEQMHQLCWPEKVT